MIRQDKRAARKGLVISRLLSLATAVAIAVIVAGASIPAGAATTTLSWTPQSSTGIAGNKLYYGTSSRNYPNSIDVGNATSHTLNNLSDGTTYYFAATNYNSSGVESAYSNEVSKTFPAIYTLTASAGSGGTITPAGATSTSTATNGTTVITSVTAVGGSTVSFSITPATGYSIAGVTVDGVAVGAVATYSFSNVTANHTLAATFTVNTYTITASAGTGGSIAPSGTTSVQQGGSKSYAISAAAGYTLAGVTVDGASVGVLSSYTFTNVTANHSISASFANNATLTSTTGWQNLAFPSQSGVFTATFDIMPSASNIDAVTALSPVSAQSYTDLAAIVRFNTSGYIDVRNGGTYSAAVTMPYQGGSSYHIRMAVNLPQKAYDVYVTPPGGTETRIATGYLFRTEQAGASSLSNLSVIAPQGSHKVSNLQFI